MIQFNCNDKFYKVEPFNDVIKKDFEAWIACHHLKEIQDSHYQLNDQEYSHLISDYFHKKASGFFSWGSKAWEDYLSQLEHQVWLFWQCFLPHNRNIKEEDIKEMMKGNDDKFVILFKELNAG